MIYKSRYTRWLGALLACMSLGAAVPVWGQSLDSLERVLAEGRLVSEEKIDVYEQLTLGYINDNPKRARLLSGEGLRLAEKEGNTKAQSAFLYYLGGSYYNSLIYDSAAYYFDKA